MLTAAVYRYATGEAVGVARFTPEGWEGYLSASEPHTGTAEIGAVEGWAESVHLFKDATVALDETVYCGGEATHAHV